jgi:hypothetical protein
MLAGALKLVRNNFLSRIARARTVFGHPLSIRCGTSHVPFNRLLTSVLGRLYVNLLVEPIGPLNCVGSLDLRQLISLRLVVCVKQLRQVQTRTPFISAGDVFRLHGHLNVSVLAHHLEWRIQRVPSIHLQVMRVTFLRIMQGLVLNAAGLRH